MKIMSKLKWFFGRLADIVVDVIAGMHDKRQGKSHERIKDN